MSAQNITWTDGTDGTIKFLASDNITVYPSTKRGADYLPKSMSIVESSFTQPRETFGLPGYVHHCTKIDTNLYILAIIIAGYYFEIRVTYSELNKLQSKYTGICINENKQLDYIQAKTFSSTNDCLDVGGVFYGLIFGTQQQLNDFNVTQIATMSFVIPTQLNQQTTANLFNILGGADLKASIDNKLVSSNITINNKILTLTTTTSNTTSTSSIDLAVPISESINSTVSGLVKNITLNTDTNKITITKQGGGTSSIDLSTYVNKSYSLSSANTSTIGGIKVGKVVTSSITAATGSTSNRNYAVQIDKDNKAFVNVPWTSGSGGTSVSITGNTPFTASATPDCYLSIGSDTLRALRDVQIQRGTANSNRLVYFADQTTQDGSSSFITDGWALARINANQDFTYNPSTHTLKVSNIDGKLVSPPNRPFVQVKTNTKETSTSGATIQPTTDNNTDMWLCSQYTTTQKPVKDNTFTQGDILYKLRAVYKNGTTFGDLFTGGTLNSNISRVILTSIVLKIGASSSIEVFLQ